MKKFIPVLICITIFVQFFTMPGIAAETADVFIGKPPEPEIVILDDDAVITQNNDDISLFDLGDPAPGAYKTTMSFEDEYFKAYFEGKTLKAEGKTKSNKEYCMIVIKEKDSSNNGTQVPKVAINSYAYFISYDLSGFNNGTYYLSLFLFNMSESENIPSTLSKIPFNITSDGIEFEHPFTEDENAYYKSFIENNAIDKDFYLKIPEDELTTEQYNTIKDTAESITAGLTYDYDKIVAVHDYIAENTYYDYVAVEAGDISDQADPY